MTIDRRSMLSAGVGVGLAAAAADAIASARSATAAGRPLSADTGVTDKASVGRGSADKGLVADLDRDQSAALQELIDEHAARNAPLMLPPGRFRAANITLRPGSVIHGSFGRTVLSLAAPGAMFHAERATDVFLAGLEIDGGALPADTGRGNGLIVFRGADRITLDSLTLRHAGARALSLEDCSGLVTRSRITSAADAAVLSLDARGLAITDCVIEDCGNNGIQVWRSKSGEDGTLITGNRIARISARSGGTGQNGNGVNVFRAAGVIVEGNRITDCAYSAVRGNAASNISIVANSCQRIGEVALYAEFAFEGALISSNVVDDAAAGISVTNFNEGGRLAVVQGNLIRNLKRREAEPVDKRGEGITVEADASVTGNTIENAPTAGIVIGWGRYMRDVVATGNLVRNSRHGILVSADVDAGACFIANNMLSGIRDGAIRAMRQGTAFGPDLARETTDNGRVRIASNMAV